MAGCLPSSSWMSQQNYWTVVKLYSVKMLISRLPHTRLWSICMIAFSISHQQIRFQLSKHVRCMHGPFQHCRYPRCMHLHKESLVFSIYDDSGRCYTTLFFAAAVSACCLLSAAALAAYISVLFTTCCMLSRMRMHSKTMLFLRDHDTIVSLVSLVYR